MQRASGMSHSLCRDTTDGLVTQRTARADLVFLSKRLVGKAGHNGVSSDAMIACAVTGSPMPDDIRPYDLGDYSSCCEAFDIAPYDLRRRMLPQLVAWGQLLLEEQEARNAAA